MAIHVLLGRIWGTPLAGIIILRFTFPGLEKRLDVSVRVLLSRVAGIAIGIRSTLPRSKDTLNHAAALPVSSFFNTSTRLFSQCCWVPGGHRRSCWWPAWASGSCI